MHIHDRHPDIMFSFEIGIKNAGSTHSFNSSHFIILGIDAIIDKPHLICLTVSHPELIRVLITHERSMGQVMQCDPPRALDNSLLGKVIIVFCTLDA